MGKIKPKSVRKAAVNLLERGIEFEEDFEKNKKILGNDLPSKKMRNQLAGLIAKMKKRERLENEQPKKITS